MCSIRKIGFYFILYQVVISYGNGQLCGNTFFGERDPRDKDDDIDTNTGFGYMMGDPDYIIDCCGIVDRWTAEFDNVAGGETIVFQIWRPDTGGTYTLVGQNTGSVPGRNEHDFNIGQSNRITVKPNDRWGWWSPGTDVITYKTGNNEEDNNAMLALSALTTGNTQDWSGATVESRRSYGARVDVLPNNDPSFSNLPNSVTVQDAAAIGTSLFTVIVSDIDTYDVSTLSVTITTSTDADYSLDTTTMIVSTAGSLAGATRQESITFRVTDQCGNNVDATLTINIQNQPPEIHNLPAAVYLSEDTTQETLLFTINATDTSGSVTCTDATVTQYPFLVRQIPASQDYGIYNEYSPGFDYTTKNQYDLTISCSDGDLSATGTFTVYLTKNAAPVIVNLQNSTAISTTDVIGTTAFTVQATDAENDGLTFTMVCDPNPCPFAIFDSGAIQITEDLSAHTTVGYDIQVTVSDGKNTVGPKILTITLADINDPVQLTNVPISLTVTENTASGTSLYTVSYSDRDTSQTRTFSMSSLPTSGLTYFSLDSSTGILTTSAAINYESVPSTTYTFTVTVSDPVTSDSGTITMEIVNVNEAPVFSPKSYAISTTEGMAGTVIGTLSFGVTDEDTADTASYHMDCGAYTGYFQLTSATGQVRYQSDYDLDAGSLPTTVSCTVTVTDSGGLSDTATLDIYIADSNDNTPIFSPTAYTFHVSYYATAGVTIGTVTATDGDAGAFGTLTFTINQSTLLVEHFAVDNNGVITLLMAPAAAGSALTRASSVTITATATDSGGLLDTASVIIVVSDSTTTSTTTTTDRYRDFLDDSKNIAWLCAAALLGLVSIGVLIYIGYTCHGEQGCGKFMRNVCRKRTKSYRFDRRRPRVPSSDDFRREHRSVRQPNINTVRPPPPPVEAQGWR